MFLVDARLDFDLHYDQRRWFSHEIDYRVLVHRESVPRIRYLRQKTSVDCYVEIGMTSKVSYI
jgi:hypothetical protein